MCDVRVCVCVCVWVGVCVCARHTHIPHERRLDGLIYADREQRIYIMTAAKPFPRRPIDVQTLATKLFICFYNVFLLGRLKNV